MSTKKRVDRKKTIAIIGGGIAGVSLAWRLQQKMGSGTRIIVLEGSDRWGGRVHTVKGRFGGEKCQFEAGGARFFSSHHELVRIMKHFGYRRDSWYPIKVARGESGEFKFKKPITQRTLETQIQKAIKGLKLHKKECVGLSLRQALNKIGTPDIDWLFTATGYPHILDTHLESGLDICERDYLDNFTYYLFTPGLEVLVQSMIGECRKNNSKGSMAKVSFTRGKVTGWTRMDRGFSISVVTPRGDRNISAECCVCTLPPGVVANLNIDKNTRVKDVLASIKSVPLLRQFGVYPDVSMFPPKIVTDDLLQRQYLGGGGLVQTSYTSGKKALQWVNMEDSEKADTLARLQNKNYSEKVPPPKWRGEYFWEHGVHLWKPSSRSIDTLTLMVNKDADDDCLWFCGEAYAKEKRWINSALQSSLQVCRSITRYFNQGGGKPKKTMKKGSRNNVKSGMKGRKDGKGREDGKGRKDGKGREDGKGRKDGKEWTMEEIKTANRKEGFHLIVIHGKVYNVHSWLQSHPGGQGVLHKYLGKDASEAYEGDTWEGHRHSSHARNILKKYYRGEFKKI